MITNRYIVSPNLTAGSVTDGGDRNTWTGSGDERMPTSNYYRKEILNFGNATLCEIFNCMPPRVQFNIGGLPKRRINQPLLFNCKLLTFGNATLCGIFNCTPPRVQFNIGRLPKRKTINHYFQQKGFVMNKIINTTDIDLQEDIIHIPTRFDRKN